MFVLMFMRQKRNETARLIWITSHGPFIGSQFKLTRLYWMFLECFSYKCLTLCFQMGFLNRLCIVQEIGLDLELIYASGCYLFVFFKCNFFYVSLSCWGQSLFWEVIILRITVGTYRITVGTEVQLLLYKNKQWTKHQHTRLCVTVGTRLKYKAYNLHTW